jgi:cystathionine gamma-synthase
MSDRFETLAVHAGADPDEISGGVSPSIQMSTTFRQDAIGKPRRGYEYGRSGNPTRQALEAAIASLEGASHGLAYASGLAATQNVLYLLEPGDRLILSDDAYGGTWRLASKVWGRYGVQTDAVDLCDLDALAATLAGSPPARMVWVETPTNPLLKVVDISAVARLAASAGALTVVDNTFATPFIQRPLDLGADIVMHSATKYLSGHSDVISGLLVTRRDDLEEKLRFHQNAAGAVPSPFDCWLVMRGMRTVAVRMDRASANAAALADWLAGRDEVSVVNYPGLADHPHHELAMRQMRLPGAMLSFELSGGEPAARRLAEGTRGESHADSLRAVVNINEHTGHLTKH